MLSLISLHVFKDVLSPAFIFCLPWILGLMGLAVSNFSYSPNGYIYFYIVLGAIIFISGFWLVMNNISLKKRYAVSQSVYNYNKTIFIILIFLEIIFTLYIYYVHFSYIRSHFMISIYQTLRHGLTTDTLLIPGYLLYTRSIIFILTICMVIISFNINKIQNGSFKKILYIQLIITLANLLLIMSRNSLLIGTLPILIAFLVCRNFNNTKIVNYAGRFILGFLIFFSLVAIMKVSYMNQYESNVELLTSQFALYMSGSLVALEKVMDHNVAYLYGENTFRFFYAISDKIFGTAQAQQLVQESISIGDGQGTNVYTFYQYYIRDFGIAYALVVQFVIGIFHGFLYRMMLTKKPIKIFYFSIMIYPLVMQFFQDQYISLLSTWIQHLVVGLIFFNSGLFVSKVDHKQQMETINNTKIKMKSHFIKV
ncbi:O-antigen polymerase [Metabacillus indicus]|uniref:O-antigen polymerase n=1 Tax=Metabacillus indicus TaxID=246786 RepID=UPI002493C080|nr:O-antigen polymerase [Metabacillus indicus]